MIGARWTGRVPAVGTLGAAFLLVLASSAPARSQAVRELTVDECVRLGLARNASLRAAGADAAAARASYAQVRAGRLPSVRAQGGYTRLSGNIPPVEFTLPGTDSTFVFQGVELNRYDAELTVEQPLFTGLQLHHRVRAAAQEAEATALDAEQARADVALEIRRAFWNLVRARGVRTSVEVAIGDVDAHVRDVRNRLSAGTVLTRDVLAAQTRRSEVLLERVDADNAVRVGQLELNRLIGLPLTTAIRPVPGLAGEGGAIPLDAAGILPDTAGIPRDSTGIPLDSADLPLDTAGIRLDSAGTPAGAADVDRLTTEALAGRPQLGALAARVNALGAQLRAAQGARLPQISFVGRYIYSRPNPYFFMEPDRFHHTWELGLSASWDLWTGGRIGAQAAEARARLQAAEARLADTREQVAVDVARQRLEVRRAGEALAAARGNVDAARESFRVARQQFDEGAALSSDVLAAEQAYRRAQASQVGATADYAIARASLLDTLGRVW